jgi:hypothetical protein
MPSATKAKQARRSSTPPSVEPKFDGSAPIPMQDPNSKYQPTAWGSDSAVGGAVDLTTPSGQTCLVRRPGLQGLMKAGVLHNLDLLSSIVDEKHMKRVGKGAKKSQEKELDVQSIMNDQHAIDEVLHVMDRVVTHCVVQPQVLMTPNDITNRNPDVIYADMIDLQDKVFIFNFVVGGSRDIARFRRELGESVGGLDAVEGVQASAV